MIPVAYRELLRRREIRRLILVAMVARLPNTAAVLVLTLHIVQDMESTGGFPPYTAAGVVTATFTVGMAIGSPWRGRLVDQQGLRRAIVPSIVAQGLTWPAMGLVPYWPLIAVAFVSGLFALPTFSVVRKALSVMTEPAQRQTAFALDSVCVELIFMGGPAVGTWAAMQFGPAAVLVVVGVATAGAGSLLWWYDPPMSSGAADAPVASGRALSWMTGPVVIVLAVSLASSLSLTGTDVGVLAELRELDQVAFLGLAYTVWCAASAIGGLMYGALHRSISPVVLALVLGLCTAPLAFSHSVPVLFALLFVAGFACAPLVASSGDALARLVPEGRRGEALGWQGTAFTAGSTIGAPLAGVAIDAQGASGGFALVAGLTVVIALAGAAVQVTATRRARRRPDVPSDAPRDAPNEA